jgi:hypothetical protein
VGVSEDEIEELRDTPRVVGPDAEPDKEPEAWQRRAIV